MDKKYLTEPEVVERIKAIVTEEGSQTNAAYKLGFSAAYLSDVLAGRRNVSAAMAKKLGYSVERIFVLSD
jgi:plasmid maintenance system antidote protein VapI